MNSIKIHQAKWDNNWGQCVLVSSTTGNCIRSATTHKTCALRAHSNKCTYGGWVDYFKVLLLCLQGLHQKKLVWYSISTLEHSCVGWEGIYNYNCGRTTTQYYIWLAVHMVSTMYLCKVSPSQSEHHRQQEWHHCIPITSYCSGELNTLKLQSCVNYRLDVCHGKYTIYITWGL